MNAGRFVSWPAAAAGLLLAGAFASGAAAQNQESERRKPQMQPSTPSEVHTRCEHLAGKDRAECERRMMDRMRNSSDATRTDDPAIRDRPGADDSEASSEPQRERATRERSDRTRIGRRDIDERTRDKEERSETTSGSDTLDRPPSDDSTHPQPRPESMQQDPPATQDENEESDTLEPKRDDNSATDTESPR
jgi:hypothetical protein